MLRYTHQTNYGGIMAKRKYLDYCRPMTVSISTEPGLQAAADEHSASLDKSRSEYIRDLIIADLVKAGKWVDVRAQ
jgi:hypothetical protein